MNEGHPARFVVGDEWAYRQRDDATSERVRILSIIPKKASARVEIAFLDNPDGRVATVPGSRLRVPWAEVAAFDARMADWQRLDDLDVDRTEEGCIEEVCRLLIPEDVAELLWSPVCCAIRILDKARLNTIIGVPVDEVLAAAQWFDRDNQLVVSPAGTLLIVEAACRANPMPVLKQVIEQEIESRHKCKHGSEHIDAHTRKNEPTSPEWEYERYRRFDRPRHELLRQRSWPSAPIRRRSCAPPPRRAPHPAPHPSAGHRRTRDSARPTPPPEHCAARRSSAGSPSRTCGRSWPPARPPRPRNHPAPPSTARCRQCRPAAWTPTAPTDCGRCPDASPHARHGQRHNARDYPRRDAPRSRRFLRPENRRVNGQAVASSTVNRGHRSLDEPVHRTLANHSPETSTNLDRIKLMCLRTAEPGLQNAINA